MPYEVTEVRNPDIAGIVERTDEIVYECAKSQSAGVTDMNSFDRDRLTQYQNLLKAYAEWVVSSPGVDLPETHPREYSLKYISTDIDDDVENKSIRDIIRLYRALMTEMSNGQSAKLGSGMIDHDKRRFDLIMTKIDAFLSSYVDTQQPVDMPETSPSSEPVSQGYMG